MVQSIDPKEAKLQGHKAGCLKSHSEGEVSLQRWMDGGNCVGEREVRGMCGGKRVQRVNLNQVAGWGRTSLGCAKDLEWGRLQ